MINSGGIPAREQTSTEDERVMVSILLSWLNRAPKVRLLKELLGYFLGLRRASALRSTEEHKQTEVPNGRRHGTELVPSCAACLWHRLTTATLFCQAGRLYWTHPKSPAYKVPRLSRLERRGSFASVLSERGSWKVRRLGELPGTPACCLGGGFTITGLWVSLSPWRRSVHV